MDQIVIVTEANETVATGHLMECIACAEALMKAGYAVSFWINHDAADSLKSRIPCVFREYFRSVEEDCAALTAALQISRPAVVIFNLREITEDFLCVFRMNISDDTTVICIDEFGHRNLKADIIINPMIDPYYWSYGENDARLFCGAQYLILSDELETFHKKEKNIRPAVHEIVISMGGVDPRGYTLELAEIVPSIYPQALIHIILGGGNRQREEILRRTAGKETIKSAENIPDLPKKIYEADLLICAGGNTLHEAACIGTPAIVLPSAPHEKRTAACFAAGGFGLVGDTDASWQTELVSLLEKMHSQHFRNVMSISGKKLSDGRGRKRVVEIVEKECGGKYENPGNIGALP